MKPVMNLLIAVLFILPGCATVADVSTRRAYPHERDSLPDRWVVAASAVSRVFETGSAEPGAYDAITDNFDGQGMSVGTMQWNLGQGSIKRLLTRVRDIDTVVAATMPVYGVEFKRNALVPPDQGVAYAKQLQNDDATWDSFRRELRAFLIHPRVQQAQRTLEQEAAQQAWRFAIEFGRATHADKPVSFPEFAFFYDSTVQGGSGYVRELIPVMQRFVDQQGESITEAAKSRARTSAGFVSMKEDVPCVRPSSPRSAAGNAHLWDGQQNCVTWREMLQRDELSYAQQMLLSLTMLRSFLAVNQYAQNFFNRKGLLVTGMGHANGRHCDIRSTYAALDSGADVRPSEITSHCTVADQLVVAPPASPGQ